MTSNPSFFAKLKPGDRLLLLLPLFAILFLNLLLLGVQFGMRHFNATLDREIMTGLAQKAELSSRLVRDRLQAGHADDAQQFCRNFDNRIFRITLISPAGEVLADSTPERTLFDNHRDRGEVKAALEGRPSFAKRYSGTLNETMIYHALPLATPEGTYVLRFALPASPYEKIIAYVTSAMIVLMAASILLLGWLQIYLIRRVYGPLQALGNTAAAILDGDDTRSIPVPAAGPVRELASLVARMTEQLRSRLDEVTQERNERNLLFDTMSEAVLLFEPGGELRRANHAAAKLFGFTEPSGPFNLGRCQIPELLTLARETFGTQSGFEREFTLERNGVARSLFIKGRWFCGDGGRRLLLTATELTNLRKLESFRSDFVANVSHEIKTPLTCIVGAVEALEETPTPDARQRLLEILKQQSKRLNNLVHDILSLAALEKAQRAPDRNFSEIALDSVALNAVNLCMPHALAARIQLAVKVEALKIQGDAALLEQSLVNLIENAIQYSNGQRIDVSLRRAGNDAILEVRDDGIGISAEHQARIFERFYRVDKSRSRGFGGTGLGLAIVKHIVQLHNGQAELQSQPARGCTFRMILPLEGGGQ